MALRKWSKNSPGPHQLHIVECRLEGLSASAGIARSIAMDYAASLIGEGVILSTDADAEVPENWVEANLRAIEHGADAVCGQAVIDPIEALRLIPMMRAWGAAASLRLVASADVHPL
jgi:hypothetical protein